MNEDVSPGKDAGFYSLAMLVLPGGTVISIKNCRDLTRVFFPVQVQVSV